MATAQSHTLRKLGSQKTERFSHKPWIIINTTNLDHLPEDLNRRSRIITLSSPPEIISANVPDSGKTKLATAAA